jgi:hypothetical protein
MLSRRIGGAIVLAVSLVYAAPAQADWLHEFFCNVARDTKRRSCWPQPFICPDRQAVREPFAVMVANGWQRQNMLADHHFQAADGQLTEAGRLKVQWILNDAPEQHREIYVHRAATPQEMAVRMQIVQQFVAQVASFGPPPPVLETNMPDEGWAAERVDAIGRKLQAATPDPKLPPKDQGNGGSSK